MSATFQLAHLSDLHLGPMPIVWPWHWTVKRAFGVANWMFKRRHLHIPVLADLILADISRQAIDHIAVSGDLTNIGIPGEHRRALAWLQRAGPPERISAVPGNHDIYCRLWRDRGVMRWTRYMSSIVYQQTGLDEHSAPKQSHDTSGIFPFVRRWGKIALIGVNSAIPTKTGSAIGEIGPGQLQRLEAVLTDLQRQQVCRVVMLHHPPLPGQAGPARALRDAHRLEHILTTAGAELVIHGHNHRNMLEYRDWRTRPLPVVGAPSCSAAIASPLPAAYNIYTFTPAAQGYEITLIQRQVQADGVSIAEVRRQRLMTHA